MKEYIARPNYEYELTELTEPGKLCGPPGVFVKKYDCARAIVKAREEGRRELANEIKAAAKLNPAGEEFWSETRDVYIIGARALDALLDAKEAGE